MRPIRSLRAPDFLLLSGGARSAGSRIFCCCRAVHGRRAPGFLLLSGGARSAGSRFFVAVGRCTVGRARIFVAAGRCTVGRPRIFVAAGRCAVGGLRTFCCRRESLRRRPFGPRKGPSPRPKRRFAPKKRRRFLFFWIFSYIYSRLIEKLPKNNLKTIREYEKLFSQRDQEHRTHRRARHGKNYPCRSDGL